MTELYDFASALPLHIRFVLFVILDLKHFFLSRSPNFRHYSAGLDKSYVPCSRDTSEKLAHVIAGLMSHRLQSAIDAAKKRWGEPFCGFQVGVVCLFLLLKPS